MTEPEPVPEPAAEPDMVDAAAADAGPSEDADPSSDADPGDDAPLAPGELTEAQAQELLDLMWVKFDEITLAKDSGEGFEGFFFVTSS